MWDCLTNVDLSSDMVEVMSKLGPDRIGGWSLSGSMELPPPSVLAHVVDVHCHPTDTDIPDGFPGDLPIKICAMSAQTRDQPLVRDIATRSPDKVTPAFGAFISRQL